MRKRKKLKSFLFLILNIIICFYIHYYSNAYENINQYFFNISGSILGRNYFTWRYQMEPYKNQGSIYFGLVSVINSDRQNTSYKMWIKQLHNSTRHKAVFLTEPGKLYIKDVEYHPPLPEYVELCTNKLLGKTLRDLDKDRAAKRLTGAYYFLKENYSWYWSATDDIVVDIDNLDKLVSYLDNKYDTNRDLVFEGHCFSKPKYSYLQGGTGFIMSRAACKKFLEYGKEWITEMDNLDDISFQKITKLFNLHDNQTLNPFMYGHNFQQNMKKGFYNKSHIDKCPTTLRKHSCGNMLVPLTYITCLHSSSQYDSYLIMQSIIDANFHQNDLYFYYNSIYIMICRGSPYFNPNYQENMSLTNFTF